MSFVGSVVLLAGGRSGGQASNDPATGSRRSPDQSDAAGPLPRGHRPEETPERIRPFRIARRSHLFTARDGNRKAGYQAIVRLFLNHLQPDTGEPGRELAPQERLPALGSTDHPGRLVVLRSDL